MVNPPAGLLIDLVEIRVVLVYIIINRRGQLGDLLGDLHRVIADDNY